MSGGGAGAWTGMSGGGAGTGMSEAEECSLLCLRSGGRGGGGAEELRATLLGTGGGRVE